MMIVCPMCAGTQATGHVYNCPIKIAGMVENDVQPMPSKPQPDPLRETRAAKRHTDMMHDLQLRSKAFTEASQNLWGAQAPKLQGHDKDIPTPPTMDETIRDAEMLYQWYKKGHVPAKVSVIH